MNSIPATRPEWTINNPCAFIFWMKTGDSELPADWIDDGGTEELTNGSNLEGKP